MKIFHLQSSANASRCLPVLELEHGEEVLLEVDVDEVFEEGHLVRDLGRVDLVAKRANPVKRLGPVQHMAGNVVEGAELKDIIKKTKLDL